MLVDGGHRAIKYSRLHGIRPDIYPEGTHLVVSSSSILEGKGSERIVPDLTAALVGIAHHLRCEGQAEEYRFVDGYQGLADGELNFAGV